MNRSKNVSTLNTYGLDRIYNKTCVVSWTLSTMVGILWKRGPPSLTILAVLHVSTAGVKRSHPMAERSSNYEVCSKL